MTKDNGVIGGVLKSIQIVKHEGFERWTAHLLIIEETTRVKKIKGSQLNQVLCCYLLVLQSHILDDRILLTCFNSDPLFTNECTAYSKNACEMSKTHAKKCP